ncbi:MAG: Glu/Leu/Phe/Val dehydrogenase [Candidatus Hydrogenedentes bacterium]|nr:Glu/Leu/Phe/Val dehydrogenase [Candidatus Hydrogenedentota bacterium]
MRIGNNIEDYVLSKEPPTRSARLLLESARRMRISTHAIQEVIKPYAVHIQRLPVPILGAVVNIISGIVLHNRARGPYKGGIRLAKDVDLWETTELARLMTLKTALADIELGGGKSGISVDLRALYNDMKKAKRFRGAYREFERIAKTDIMTEFARHFGPLFASHEYVPAPDMGSGGPEMVCIYNETYDPASVTGKPDGIEGWLPGRAESTGYGVYYAVLKDLEKRGISPAQTTITIQGFGKVGSHAARFLYDAGARIVAVTDMTAGVHAPQGLDIPALIAHCNRVGHVDGFRAKSISNAALFALKCDYLIPAATGHVIHADNAASVKAKAVVEAANMPVTYEAMKSLEERGITVIPDTYANAGGVIASNLEFRQALGGPKFNRDAVLAHIRDRFDAMLAAMEPFVKRGRSMSEASTDVALQRVYETMVQRNLV